MWQGAGIVRRVGDMKPALSKLSEMCVETKAMAEAYGVSTGEQSCGGWGGACRCKVKLIRLWGYLGVWSDKLQNMSSLTRPLGFMVGPADSM